MSNIICFDKIDNNVSFDSFVSNIDSLGEKVDDVNLDVYFTFKKIFEIEDKMFVLLDIYDDSGEMKALMCGEKNNYFISLIDNIKYGLKYRINGNISNIDYEIKDYSLSFADEIKNTKVFVIKALQCYSDTIYGIDINEFNGCLNVQQEYDVVFKYTDYFKNIDVNQVKNIEVSCYGEIFYLLNDGKLFCNGNLKLDNINKIHCIDSHTICAIGNGNTITCLTDKHVSGFKFLNDNYQYKKILTNEFGVYGLRSDGIVVYFGTIVSSVIDVSRFIDVDDIFINEEDDIIVVKGNEQYTLFHIND